MRWSTLLVALLVLTAGCLGASEDDGAPDANAGDDGPEQPRLSWETITRSNTVTGAGTPLGSVSQGEGNSATWTVAEGTDKMWLNVTAEGGELSIDYGPDCDTEGPVSCPHTMTTEGGEASVLHEAPASGGWEIYVFLTDDVGEVDWELSARLGTMR